MTFPALLNPRMSKTQITVDLFPVHKERFIPAIARTVHHAFSSDPLIRWLRPNAVPWVQQDTGTWSWQYRRIQQIIFDGQVFRSGSVGQLAKQYPQRGKYQQSTTNADTGVATLPEKEPATSLHDEAFASSSDDAGAVVFLFPPPGQSSWSIQRLWLACKLWLLDRFTPAHDSGVREKRVEVLLDKHEASEKLLRTRYPRQKLWYLEVIAVHPSLQSRGLGGGVMRWILEHVRNEPIYLECTREDNLGFYQSFGFEVIEVVELTEDEDQSDVFKHWVMVRSGKS